MTCSGHPSDGRRTLSNLFHVMTLLLVCALLGSRAYALPLGSTVAAGATHSVSVHSDGTLWAAGANDAGQLGDGTMVARSTPVQIGGTNWIAAAAGERHTVALQANGTLWAWGDNSYGQLGSGSNTAQLTPTRVGIDTDWAAIAVGAFHTVAIKKDHSLWAWGANSRGQVGDGTTIARNAPTRVVNNVKFVTAGYQHTVAVLMDGTLWAWGSNGYGQIGNGWIQDQYSPVHIGSDANWTGVAAGQYHTLAWKSDGSLWGWGLNASGQLGIGSWTNQWSPVVISGVSNVVAAAGGKYHSVAVRKDGTLWSWGANSEGQLGDGTLADQSTPIQIGVGTTWSAVAAGNAWGAAMAGNGLVWVWGANQFGQLGTGEASIAPTPVRVGSATNWTTVASKGDHTLALKLDGSLWAWGGNQYGQLGIGGTTTQSHVVQVGSNTNWKAIATGTGHSAGVRNDGTLWTWGQNTVGQLGDGTQLAHTQPMQVGTATNWASVAVGEFFSVAVKKDGTLWGWGQDAYGQLGDGGTANQSSPIRIGADANWARVVAGKSHTVALKTDGTLWSWGYNGYGQLGDGTNLNHGVPKQVGVATWKTIAAGNNHTLAVRSDGTLWAWGDNLRGQLGDASFSIKWNPVQIGAAVNWVAVSAGAMHSFGHRGDASLWAWGYNADGQVGDGSQTNRSSPVNVGGGIAWAAADGGSSHSVGVSSDGKLFSWGSNPQGQLGQGDSWSPQPALSAPVVLSSPSRTAAVGTLYQYTFNVADLDGDPFTRNARTLPAWLSFNSATGVLSGTPRAGDAGSHSVVLTASDGILTTTYRFVIDVSGGAASDQVLNLSFDEGGGTQSADNSTNAASATLVNAGWDDSFDGNALTVNGPGYATVPDASALNVTNAMTLDAWIKPSANKQTAAVVAKASDLPPTLSYGLSLQLGALAATLNGQLYVSTYVVPRNVWTHVAMTWDGAVMKLYANGAQVYNAAASASLVASSQPLLIGARSTAGGGIADGFVGSIDRVQLWRIERGASALCNEAGRSWDGAACGGSAFGNVAPVAKSASYAIGSGRVLTGNLMATDDNPASVTYMLAGAPTKGTVQIIDRKTGAFRYTPATTGTDKFSFRVADYFSVSSAATVTITITSSAVIDSDGDGMSDVDESSLGLNMYSAADAALDRDQDGVSNANELTSGRDPTIPFETDAQHVLGMSFREGTGTAVHDATVAANHGALAGNNAKWAAGSMGNNLRVTATAGVRIPDDSTLDIAGALSIEMWIKPAGAGQTSFVLAKSVGGAYSAFDYGLGLAKGRLRGVLTGNNYASDFIVPANVWTHVALTWDGTKVRLYANGNEVLVANRTAALATNSAALLIGARGTATSGMTQGFSGDIDQVNVWRGALSATEVCVAGNGTFSVGVCTH